MRLKTQYREKNNPAPAADIPAVEINNGPNSISAAEIAEAKSDNPTTIETGNPDFVLKRQIEALQQCPSSGFLRLAG